MLINNNENMIIKIIIIIHDFSKKPFGNIQSQCQRSVE